MPPPVLPDQAKRFLKRVPGVQWLNSIRLQIIRIRELSDLIHENRVVVFHLHSRVGNDIASTRALVQEVMKEWIDLYGIIRLRETTAAAIDSQAPIILLWGPMALLKIPSTHEEYLNGARRETRREIRQAEKHGYEFREFVWNEHLDEIYDINTSKEIRQSEPMRGWYREPVRPRYHSQEELRYRKYYGAFKDGKLYAYFHLYLCGDLAIGKHFLGHAKHLKFGIMNGLISYTVRECIENSQIRWLNYADWQRKGSLNAFKQHAGFQEYAILLDLEGDQDLLRCAAQKVRTIWYL